MNIFGLNITRQKSGVLQPVRAAGGFFGPIRESFAGAWQRNVEVESRECIVSFSAVYSCVSLIANDIAKLRPCLVELQDSGIWTEVEGNSPFLPVLAKPNRYQTWFQFASQWIIAKLLYGNTYVLKERDARGIVTALYILNSNRTKPLISEDGGVYYQLTADQLNLQDSVTLPASEIIHDRGDTLWHPLVGVSPIYACGSSATQGLRIQANSVALFENMSRPGGVLTAPGTIDQVTADRLQRDFDSGFGGRNLGKTYVAGDGLAWNPMNVQAVDAQLIEQLRWTAEDIARCFKVPLYMISGGMQPTFNNISSLKQDYYDKALHAHIQSMEELLDEGMSLPNQYSIRLDLDDLLRMDPLTMAQVQEIEIRSAIRSPNEARKQKDLPPVPGGDTPYMQQQNFSLAALDQRDQNDPFSKPATPPPGTQSNQEAPPPPAEQKSADPSVARLVQCVEETIETASKQAALIERAQIELAHANKLLDDERIAREQAIAEAKRLAEEAVHEKQMATEFQQALITKFETELLCV